MLALAGLTTVAYAWYSFGRWSINQMIQELRMCKSSLVESRMNHDTLLAEIDCKLNELEEYKSSRIR